MVRAPLERDVCLMPGSTPNARRNAAAISLNIVICKEDEVCVPFHFIEFPWPRENDMMPSVEIGYYFRLECI